MNATQRRSVYKKILSKRVKTISDIRKKITEYKTQSCLAKIKQLRKPQRKRKMSDSTSITSELKKQVPAVIESLTPEQEAAMPRYVEEWTKISLATRKDVNVNEEDIVKHALQFYKNIGKEPPKHGVRIVDDPDQAKALAREYGAKVVEFSSFGQHDANVFAFYAFFRDECGLKEQTETIVPLIELAKMSSWHLWYDDMAIIVRLPVEMHLDATNRLHNLHGPAYVFSDTFKVYAIDGFNLEEKHVMTPVDQIDSQFILGEKNADIRRCIIKRIPAEKLVQILDAKTIDSKDNYELLEIKEPTVRRYLKMKNPSIDAVHIEGVINSVNTVDEALSWRNNIKGKLS